MLQRFELHACVVRSGALLGTTDFDGGAGKGADVVCVSVDFGAGAENPLVRGLLALLSVPLGRLPALDLAQQLLFSEAQASRCGHAAVVDRLTEVLVIQLLRHALALQLVDGGVMAGLADPRLFKAISALHAHPARAWNHGRFGRFERHVAGALCSALCGALRTHTT